MLEILLAIMILAIMTIISTMVFHTVVRNWTIATEMADNMQRVDYITEQVVYALRSAYFPTSGESTTADGFMLLDHNEENSPDESDVISWTKLGPAIVGRNSRFARSPHRVTLFVRSEERTLQQRNGQLAGRLGYVKLHSPARAADVLDETRRRGQGPLSRRARAGDPSLGHLSESV